MAVYSVISSPKRDFWPKRGYFSVLPKRGFRPKQGLFKRAFSEKLTNHGKWRRTLKFTLARDENDYFHLGGILLRSARSFPHETAFVLLNEPTAATTRDPQTAGTSSPVAHQW